MKLRINTFIIASLLLGTSCTNILDAEDTKYATDDKLSEILERNTDALIQGVYSRSIEYAFYANRHDDFGQKSIDIVVDLSSEDMVHYMNSGWFINFYQFNERVASGIYSPARQWRYCYAQIRDLNSILAVLPKDGLTDKQRNLKGETLALRAHHYFTLINLYQTGGEWDKIKDLPGVPVYLEPTLEGGARGKVSDVYTQIVADYEEAIVLLDGFKIELPTRVNQLAAKALSARAYLYKGDFVNALKYSTEVVNATSLMSNDDYTKGFSDITNIEWLWGVDITSENSTGNPSFFSMLDPTSSGYAGKLGQYKSVDKRLYDNIHAGDIRKQVFKDGANEIPYLQYKFIDPSKKYYGDYLYLRAAEAHYIKAEAEARTDKLNQAKATLDNITNARAVDGQHTYTWATDVAGLIDDIFLQKRIEMWGEGLSLFEFNRLEKTIDRTYAGTNHPPANLEGGNRPLPWGSAQRVFQIPLKELEGNPNINQADQNP